ncbi:MAG TPA: hypothetical protein VF449_03765 [Parvibaculum sp.]
MGDARRAKFSAFRRRAALDVVGIGEGGYAILSYEETQWIDIGAGVPDRI